MYVAHRDIPQCPGAVAVWGGYVKPSWLRGAREVPCWERGKRVLGQCGWQVRKGRNAPLLVDGAGRELRGTERLGKRIWSFFGDVGFVVCLFVPSAQGSTV